MNSTLSQTYYKIAHSIIVIVDLEIESSIELFFDILEKVIDQGMLDKLSVIAWKPFSKIKNSIVSNFSINTENRQSTASTYIDSVSYKFSNERISIKENSNSSSNNTNIKTNLLDTELNDLPKEKESLNEEKVITETPDNSEARNSTLVTHPRYCISNNNITYNKFSNNIKSKDSILSYSGLNISKTKKKLSFLNVSEGILYEKLFKNNSNSINLYNDNEKTSDQRASKSNPANKKLSSIRLENPKLAALLDKFKEIRKVYRILVVYISHFSEISTENDIFRNYIGYLLLKKFNLTDSSGLFPTKKRNSISLVSHTSNSALKEGGLFPGDDVPAIRRKILNKRKNSSI